MAGHSSYDLVVELLNQAASEHTGAAKVILLKQVQELVINKEPNLLDNFFDEVLGFQSDKAVDVRKFVITFLEYACKVDGDIISKIIGNLNILLYDDNVNIKKKVMLSMASLYKTAIKWIVQAKIITEVMEETWKYMSQMRDHIVGLLDDDNDGIRTHSVKFCEGVVLVLTPRAVDSEAREDDQSLDLIPESHGFLEKTKLAEDGQKIFKHMLEFLGSQSITSVNLMACMTSMTTLARRRPQYMTQVIGGFESLHVNLPPTLAKSQVSSVRKSLKLQMLSVLKHPAAADMIPQIATLLTDLGATQTEVTKAMPKPSELAASRKRKAESEAELQRTKKSAKTEMTALPLPELDDDDEDAEESLLKPKDALKPFNPVEITTEDIIPKLSSNNVADLVLLSMVMLPDDMPAHFQSTYTPIAAAGTPGQIKHISRLLAVQLTNVGLGKGVEDQKERERKEAEEAKKNEAPNSSIEVVGGFPDSLEQLKKAQFMVPMSGTSAKKTRIYDLERVTKPMLQPVSVVLATSCLQRIFKAEADATKANLNAAFCKLAAGLTTQFGGFMREMLYDFIMNDIKNRADLALTWVYNEYVAYQGFTLAEGIDKPSRHGYDECVCRLLNGLFTRKDQPGAAMLFTRLILESPCIPLTAVDVLKKYCADEKQMYLGMTTLSALVLKRPVLQTQSLYALLDFSYHEKAEVRNTAIHVVKELYEQPKLSHLIDEFCRTLLRHLLAPHPTHSMFPSTLKHKFDGGGAVWTEVYIKQALYLYLSILPDQPSYMDLLAEVYVKAISDIKRVILRLMEVPIKQLGVDSEELLSFIRKSPKGSETLITRIIHILTERSAPSAELVAIVKVLYKERVADVRFLIPVLGGLEKSEIMTALPKLIKLSPVVVKEVFNRLLGVGGHLGQEPAVTPSELMIALHHVTPEQCEIKSVIKATSMCFQEKTLFTQEVLAVVIQQLMEVTPLPTLFMRTVIQSLTMYPKLLGFVLNILQRLITKQVWKQGKVWEGFVRCCQRAKPQSYQVLLQLPAVQLKSAFDIAPELQQLLLKHINSFNAAQKAHLPKAVLAVIDPIQVKMEPKAPPTVPAVAPATAPATAPVTVVASAPTSAVTMAPVVTTSRTLPTATAPPVGAKPVQPPVSATVDPAATSVEEPMAAEPEFISDGAAAKERVEEEEPSPPGLEPSPPGVEPQQVFPTQTQQQQELMDTADSQVIPPDVVELGEGPISSEEQPEATIVAPDSLQQVVTTSKTPDTVEHAEVTGSVDLMETISSTEFSDNAKQVPLKLSESAAITTEVVETDTTKQVKTEPTSTPQPAEQEKTETSGTEAVAEADTSAQVSLDTGDTSDLVSENAEEKDSLESSRVSETDVTPEDGAAAEETTNKSPTKRGRRKPTSAVAASATSPSAATRKSSRRKK